jgi:hypothetical protein
MAMPAAGCAYAATNESNGQIFVKTTLSLPILPANLNLQTE